MMGPPPALPSSPPPPDPDEDVRPLSAAGATAWVLITQLCVFVAAAIVVAGTSSPLSPAAWIAVLLLQAAVYAIALVAMLSIYSPGGSIRRFIAWRGLPLGVVMLAAIAGACLSWPAGVLSDFAHQSFGIEPRNELEAVITASPLMKVLVSLGIVVIGPFVEEAIFRGGVFTPMLKRYTGMFTATVTGALFALVHLSIPNALPLFLLGVLLGRLRFLTGSLWPCFALHLTFNGMAMLATLTNVFGEELPDSWIIGAGSAAVAAIVAIEVIARRSRRAGAARREDL